MPIQNPTPITVPASQEEVYDSFWATRIIINSPSPDSKVSAFIELKPYNTTTKKTLDQAKRVPINDLWALADEKPEVENAIVAMFDAINVILEN
jgi:hypothetical protein